MQEPTREDFSRLWKEYVVGNMSKADYKLQLRKMQLLQKKIQAKKQEAIEVDFSE